MRKGNSCASQYYSLHLTALILMALDFCAGYINLADIECGQQPMKPNPKVPGVRNSRVAGGRKALHGEFPWIISFQDSEGHFCGGFLVNRSTVITAAHCFAFNLVGKDRMHVVIGEHILGRAERPIDAKAYQIASIVAHPEYIRSEPLRNDIALVHLKSHVEWSNYVQPACLSNQEDDLQDGQPSQFAGWGDIIESSGASDTLMTLELDIISHDRCEEEYSFSGVPFSTQFCAKHQLEHKGPCRGDSGGPLLIRVPHQDSLKVVGINTGRSGCGHGMLPGIYTKVAPYISWIRTNVA